ncbi:MAG: flagellar protein FlaG [Treponema sp.]|nr:flagellar protein FlaG [Treponema sp.]
MSAIQSLGRNLAMDGRLYNTSPSTSSVASKTLAISVPDAAGVAQTLADNLAKDKTYVQELQRVANSLDKKVKFNVNQELGQVVVKIVDPSTDKIIREIPSVDLQELRVTMRRTIGLIIDESV